MAAFSDNLRTDIDTESVGVMLVNLGTPDAPDTPSVRRFLRQFLSDGRVVEAPKMIWWFVLNFVILLIRPAKSAAAYKEVWTDQGSPLMVNAVKQAEALQQRFGDSGACVVRHAMSYGEPSIGKVLDELTGLGIRKVIVVPMYPQYSSTTTGSVFDEVARVLRKRRYVPSIRFVNSYAVRDKYIDALAQSIQSHWQEHGRAQRLLLSFHGIPVEYAEKGDPYSHECRATAQALVERLGLKDSDWMFAFQSRFGPKQWLQPYTEDVIEKMASEGVREVDAICPGFSVDCLETLEEVSMEYGEDFIEAGGSSFRYIPCLNDHPAHIDMLHDLVCEMASDWLSLANQDRRATAVRN